MEKTDTHTHTHYSNHGVGTPEEVVSQAVAKGLSTIAITEHLPLPDEVNLDGTFAMTLEKVEDYLQDVQDARQKYPQIEVICGFEVDWREGCEDYVCGLLSKYPHELLLGSVHMLTEKDGSYWPFDHRAYIEGWQERGEQQVWRRYFELWCDAIASKVPFAIMTHPDLPKKFGFKPKFDTRELYADVAKTAAMAGVMVEVNTNGLYKPVAEMYPSLDLLKAFADAGVPCTVSSDAHEPNNVARDIELAWALMREAGYREVTVPTRDGDRRAIPL